PRAPAHPTPASAHGSQSDHSIVSKSHADSHNPHLQIQSPLASLQVQWLLPVLRHTPASARDERPRMSSHSRKSRRGSSLREPVHDRTLRAQTSTRPPPAQSHRDPPKTAAKRAPARGSTNPSESSSAGIPLRYREQSEHPPRHSTPYPAVLIESVASRIRMHPWKTCTQSSQHG